MEDNKEVPKLRVRYSKGPKRPDPSEHEVEGQKRWQIWCEGYAATGEHSPAHYLGKSEGETFDEACVKANLNLDTNPDGTYRRGSYRGDTLGGKEKENKVGNYSIWACQLFDNEADARKSFG